MTAKKSPRTNSCIIGPSTGWLQGSFPIAEQLCILQEAGASAVEITIPAWQRDHVIALRRHHFDGIFRYRSIHLPNLILDPNLLQYQIDIAREAVRACNAQTAVMHPIRNNNGDYPIFELRDFVRQGGRIAIENMDAEKESGYEIDELAEIVRTTGCAFVLDVQHAYEHDMSGEYMRRMFEALKESLAHVHVSGQTKQRSHSRVCVADNRDAILECIRWILDRKRVPVILEGQYATAKELAKEIRVIENEMAPKAISY